MRLQTYRDKDHSTHIDLVGANRTIDLVTVTVAMLLVTGFACALVALWAH